MHRAKSEEAKAKGSWDTQSCEGNWTDDLYKAVEKVSKPTVVHQLLMLAMKLVKMLLDKGTKKKEPKKADITKKLVTVFAAHTF